MTDVSGYGLQISVVASNTFPNGLDVTAFSDDADGIDIPDITVADVAMGLNGDLITWSRASPLKVDIAVIAGSIDDDNLSILLEANRVGKGKTAALDVITVSAVYPSGNTLTFSRGKILGGSTGSSVSSAGRVKTKKFMFAFENRVGTGS